MHQMVASAKAKSRRKSGARFCFKKNDNSCFSCVTKTQLLDHLHHHRQSAIKAGENKWYRFTCHCCCCCYHHFNNNHPTPLPPSPSSPFTQTHTCSGSSSPSFIPGNILTKEEIEEEVITENKYIIIKISISFSWELKDNSRESFPISLTMNHK